MLSKRIRVPWLGRRRAVRPRWLLFCHHKGGTVLLINVFRSVADAFGLSFRVILGKPEEVPPDVDILLFGHSLIDPRTIPGTFRGVHLVRDPRDVVVSGYLYHKRCDERWCTNRDLDPKPPIMHPRVPYSQEHRPETWKQAYLASLNGKSYQDNLLALGLEDGILFELDHYGGWTTEAMQAWPLGDNRVQEMKFEAVMSGFDNAFREIFGHLGLTGDDLHWALSIAREHDLRRMPEHEVMRNKHVSSRKMTRWRAFFSDRHRAVFEKRHGSTLLKFGYEQSTKW